MRSEITGEKGRMHMHLYIRETENLLQDGLELPNWKSN